jgi:hypothetical protein
MDRPPSQIKKTSFDVTARRNGHRPGLRVLGIGIVILSVIHVPLPQADYHNVRHHDGYGEVCVHHDHLLRWHPSADSNADLTLLHWHWFLPLLEPANPHQRSDDDHHRPGSGPALHAHVGDGLVPDEWRGESLIQESGAWKVIDQLTLNVSSMSADRPSGGLGMDTPAGVLAGRASPAVFARAQRAAIFQRWNC